MATFIPTLRHDKVGKDGLAPLYVAVRHGGKKRLVALGARVRPKGWNENRKAVRKTEPDAEQVNDYLGQVVAEGGSEVARRTSAREPVTADSLADHLRAWTSGAPTEDAADFLRFFRRWVDGFAERGQPSTYKA